MNQTEVVFVSGALRSGTTLLKLILDGHPQLSNRGEFDFLFDEISNANDWPKTDDYKQWLVKDRIFQSKGLNIDETMNFPDLINDFVSQLSSNKQILMLNVHRNFHRIPYLFPSAKYIHLIRDPRDVARSSIGMGWAGNTYYGVDHWIDSEKSWDKVVGNLQPDQFYELKYEDILCKPQETLTSLCAFLGVEYSDEMLTYPSRSTYSAIDKTLAYQWRSKLNQDELQLLEGKLGDWIEKREYEPSGHQPIMPGRLKVKLLFFQNKVARVKFFIDRYGLYLFLINTLTKYFDVFSLKETCRKEMEKITIKHLK